ncbi:class I SAM-dependent methyltransferase [Brevundimonas sp.]|uniref:class I SAM-dependent methyltransferase n=1 Tax=Brevundimonas sp. TaxID=1871086 RepID=UPI003D12E63A
MTAHDLGLYSGERQVAGVYDDIRADHRYRYEWADRIIPAGGYGLDAFCGNGYGAWLLSRTRHVLGLDGSKEAVVFASDHFPTPRTLYAHAYWPFELPEAAFDFIVSLESVEHVPDGQAFFASLSRALKPGGQIIFSTPNEDLLPHQATGNHFHFKHYTLNETLGLANEQGLQVLSWAGQDCYQMTEEGRQGALLADEMTILRNETPGQFTIVSCRKPEATQLSTPWWKRRSR